MPAARHPPQAPSSATRSRGNGQGQKAMKKEEEERRRFEQTHRTMIGVRQEMKRTNDIMSSFVEDQRRNGIDEKIFMALQVLPKESVEYRSLSRQLVSSISGRNVVDENGKQDDDNNEAQDEVIEDPVQRRRMNTTRHHANERRYLHLHNSEATDEPYVTDASRHTVINDISANL